MQRTRSISTLACLLVLAAASTACDGAVRSDDAISPPPNTPDEPAVELELAWVRSFGLGRIEDLDVSQQQISIIGDFWETVDFGTGPLSTPQGDDMFVARFDLAGQATMARQYGQPLGILSYAEDRGTAVAGKADGGFVAAGRSVTAIDLGMGPIEGGLANGWMADFDGSGSASWVLAFDAPSPLDATPFALALDDQEDIYAAGVFTGPSLTIGNDVLQSSSSPAGFLVKVTADGDLSWSVVLPNPVSAIAVSPTGGVCFTGGIPGEPVPGEPPFAIAAFVGCIDAEGAPQWDFATGEVAFADAPALGIDSQGNLYVGGAYEGALDFGPAPLPTDDSGPGPVPRRLTYLASFTPTGDLRWAHHLDRLGGPKAEYYYQRPHCLVVDAEDNVYVSHDGTVRNEAQQTNYPGTTITSVSPGGDIRWTAGIALVEEVRVAVSGVDDLVISGFADDLAELGDPLEGSHRMVLMQARARPVDGR